MMSSGFQNDSLVMNILLNLEPPVDEHTRESRFPDIDNMENLIFLVYKAQAKFFFITNLGPFLCPPQLVNTPLVVHSHTSGQIFVAVIFSKG
jgi:hypothetical protein